MKKMLPRNTKLNRLKLITVPTRRNLPITVSFSSKSRMRSMAFRGAISVGRQAIPLYLRTASKNVSASHPFHRSTNPFPLYQSGLKFSTRAVNGTTVDPLAPKKLETEEQSSENWKIKMLYDGDCPLCMREVNMLRERNKEYGSIRFVDISSDDYSPDNNQGLDYITAMGRIHAILSDGTVVKDVEAFRRLYEVVGLGWVYAVTKYEPIASLADAVYGVWAKYRLQVTGRPPLEEVLEARRRKKEEVCDDSKACKM